MSPKFEVRSLGKGQFTIDEGGKTVAIITSQGFVDWLIYEPSQPGDLITKLYKETHLSWTMGLKFELATLYPQTQLISFSYDVLSGGSEVRLHAEGKTPEGDYASTTDARLFLADDGRYRWDLETSLTNVSAEPKELPRIEYNNVYPSMAGRCMLYAPKKEYRSTVITDKEGVVWSFPHQHIMPYSRKIYALHFAEGTSAGFAGELPGNPTVDVREASHEPLWDICDMYYDLHCQGRLTEPLAPGASMRYAYTIRYLMPEASRELDRRARPIPITADDLRDHERPRIDLGMNHIDKRCELDRMDDSSGFRQQPPVKVWDKEVGKVSKGSLRIINNSAEPVIWSAEPPTMIPAATILGIAAMVKTEGVTGKGAFVRVRYHAFDWHPQPHIDWVRDLESIPIAGTSDGWVKVNVPSLSVEAWELDYLIWLEVVLDGEGVAWFTDVEIDLVNSISLEPVLKLDRPLALA